QTGTGDLLPSGIEEFGALHAAAKMDADQTQLAGYGQVGFRISKRLTASAAWRVTRAKYASVFGDPQYPQFIETFGSEQHRVDAGDTTSAPRFDLSYQHDEHDLYYLTVAKGYRMGGINAPVNWGGIDCSKLPDSYAPDDVWSVEVGAKNGFLDGRVQLNTSVFHASWRNAQVLFVFDPANTICGYTANAGAATSDGFDLSLQALATDHLKLGLLMAYTDAHYTRTVTVQANTWPYPVVIIRKGDALGSLPLVPSPWNVTASIGYDFNTTDGPRISVRAEDIFHSRNPGPFTNKDPENLAWAPGREPDPTTNLLNLRADLKWPSFDLALFVDNTLDSQPTLSLRNRSGTDSLYFATTFRPRTVGLTASWRF
ncbi:MAG TPA: TonB-dependent receptor, partial [Steroidobacteraceae bacterium]|nr:TonB-dependent receptor [Steroidobacteraceae bacterium]